MNDRLTNLANLLEQEERYGIKDVLKRPFKRTYHEVIEDLTFAGELLGKRWYHNLAEVGLTLLGFAAFTAPHELIHAATNQLTGGTTKEIVVNRLYGGDLYHLLHQGIESRVLFPLIGGYVKVDEGSALAKIAVCAAPYVLTPLGIYLMQKGKEKRSLVKATLGAGLIAAHAGGVIGDFNTLGKTLVHQVTGTDHEGILKYAFAIAGFYLGCKVLGFTYRLSKAAVHLFRRKSKKKIINQEEREELQRERGDIIRRRKILDTVTEEWEIPQHQRHKVAALLITWNDQREQAQNPGDCVMTRRELEQFFGEDATIEELVQEGMIRHAKIRGDNGANNVNHPQAVYRLGSKFHRIPSRRSF